MTLYWLRRYRTAARAVPTVGKIKDFVPLARQRCVESPHPTGCTPLKLCGVRGRMISAPPYIFITLNEANNPSVSAYAEPAPLQGSLNRFCDKSQFTVPQLNAFTSKKTFQKFLRSNLSLIFTGYYMGVLRDTIPIRKDRYYVCKYFQIHRSRAHVSHYGYLLCVRSAAG